MSQYEIDFIEPSHADLPLYHVPYLIFQHVTDLCSLTDALTTKLRYQFSRNRLQYKKYGNISL